MHAFLGCLAKWNDKPVLPVFSVSGAGLVVDAQFFVDVLSMRPPLKWKDRDAADPTCYQLTLKRARYVPANTKEGRVLKSAWQHGKWYGCNTWHCVWIAVGRVSCAGILGAVSCNLLLMCAVHQARLPRVAAAAALLTALLCCLQECVCTSQL